MQMVHEDDDIRITWEPGNSGLAVVAFGGISYGTIEVGEFRKTLLDTRLSNDLYFVLDKKRKWYNGPHQERIADLLNAATAARGVRAVFTLGNSMGGTGALIYAASLEKCVRALSFCPQSSVDTRIVPFENRWSEYRAGVTDWTASDSLPYLSASREYYLFFGADDVLDNQHLARFRSSPIATNIFRIPNSGHDVALQLKRRGVLTLIVRSLMSDSHVDLPEFVTATTLDSGLLVA